MIVDHALTCSSGGPPTAHHNDIKDVIANVMGAVVTDVDVESKLLANNNEDLTGRTAIDHWRLASTFELVASGPGRRMPF